MKFFKTLVFVLAFAIVTSHGIAVAQTNIERFRNIQVSGDADIVNDLDVDGDADIDGTTNLDVTDIDGAADLDSTLDVEGATDLDSTLTVESGIVIEATTDISTTVGKAINIGDEWDYAIDAGSLPIVSSASVWYDDFLGDIVAPEYTEASGTDGQAVQALVEEQFGVYQLTSGDAGVNTAGDAEQVALSRNWQADQGALVFETRLHLDTAITTVELCAGLTDNVGLELPFTNAADVITAVAADAIAFCFDTNATTQEWFASGVKATTIATATTSTAPAADVYQVLRIEVDDGGERCRFYIDGTLVSTLTANCVTATTALAPAIVISSGQFTASHVVDIDYILVAASRD